MTPFDYLNAINLGKENIMLTPEDEKQYVSFVVNRSLSYFPDTVAIANEMNRYHHLDKKLQFFFLLNLVRKRKRFSKWIKPDLESNVQVIKEYYGYNNEKARQVADLFTADQINYIKQKLYRGGKS